MKTKEELNEIREEVEALSKKLAELSEEELAQVAGGREMKSIKPECGAFSVIPSHDMTNVISPDPYSRRALWAYDCTDCIHWQRPEGPCKLGYVVTKP